MESAKGEPDPCFKCLHRFSKGGDEKKKLNGDEEEIESLHVTVKKGKENQEEEEEMGK